MNLRLRAYGLVFATLVGAASTLIATPSYAANNDSDLVEDYRPSADNLVEMHVPIDLSLPYRERRGSGGILFGLNYEIIRPTDYASFVDLDPYSDMFGSSQMPVYQVQMGYKYNISAGALALNLGYGSGYVEGMDSNSQKRTLNITKSSVMVSYIMDTLFPEPYVAPYVAAGVARFDLQEGVAGVTSKHGNSPIGIYTVGLMFQLNWLDPTMTADNLIAVGLQNTYLDLFLSKYDGSTNDNDPEMQTGFNLGAGLRLEF